MKEPAASKKTWTSGELNGLVRAKYAPPCYLLLNEVREGTGYGAGRSADALAVGIWPSRGYDLIGFEYKSARSDWQRELAAPEKADSVMRYCDQWWLVAAEGVAMLHEIPPTWGWYAPTARGLKVLKSPVQCVPVALERRFLASLLRNLADKSVPRNELDALIDVRVQDRAREEDYHKRELLDRAGAVEQALKDFEAASGLDVRACASKWTGRASAKRLGALVKLVLDGNVHDDLARVQRAYDGVGKLLKELAAVPAFAPAMAAEDPFR